MLVSTLAALEQPLKWIAFGLGLASTVSIVQGWTLWAMVFSLPFCLIWVLMAWLRTEPQLKWINILFAALYIYGIGRHLIA
jgi:hypothetical protein